MTNEYYVLWNENLGGAAVNSAPEVHGPFSSVKKAKEFILEDAEQTIDISCLEHFGRDEEWGSRYSIVILIDTFIPVPNVSVKFGLKVNKT